MRVLSGCQGLLFVKPPLKPTLPTFSPFFDLRLLYLLLFPSVDRRWCYISDFVVNVSGACQAACTALQCCWHLWDYSPPPQSRSHSISLKGSVHVSCYFMVTKYCPTDPGNERTTVWLADVGFFSERAHCWLEYSNTARGYYNRNIDNNWVGIFLNYILSNIVIWRGCFFFFINYFIFKSASSALF